MTAMATARDALRGRRGPPARGAAVPPVVFRSRCRPWGGPRGALVVALTVLVTSVPVGQSVQAEAPWLTVYDEAGRTKWEVRMDVLVRTDSGWEGERVQVQLYDQGTPHLVLRAPRIRADRYGREWTLLTDEPSTVARSSDPIVGEGEGFSFECREARWAGGLVLVGLAAEGRGVALTAAEARWQMGRAVQLTQAEVQFAGWRLEFESGTYELDGDRLVAGEVTVTGHGMTVVGTALVAWPRVGKLHVTEARVGRAP